MFKKECGSCTKCCEGWLGATIYDKEMHKGRPCFYLDKCNNKCAIYEQRPQDPCKDYSCAWLTDEQNIFPLWMKPNLSNVIITLRSIVNNNKEYFYYDVIETGKKMESEVLNWIIHWALSSNINIRYEVCGNRFIFAQPEVAEIINSDIKKI